MDASFIEEIKNLAREGYVHEVDGKKYSIWDLKPVIYDPSPAALEVETLSGLAEYVNSGIDGNEKKNLFIVVNSHESVSVFQHLNRETMRRKHFIHAKLQGVRKFNFDEYIQLELFIILLRSIFNETPDQKRLIDFVSKIVVEDSVTNEDDGVSQKVHLRKQMNGALKEAAIAPAIVKLCPYRTFIELKQPESEFLFRMKSNYDKNIGCSLREADGGAWRLDAMKQLKVWLSENIKEVPILS